MYPAAKPELTAQVYQWLVNSTRSCNQSGDLWYYRGLAARKLGDAADANYAFRKAGENESKAKEINFDPYVDEGVRVSSPAHIHDKFALFVGIHEFKNPDSGLEFSAADATAFGTLVSSLGFKNDDRHIKTLLDSQATLSNIQEALATIRSTATSPGDLVLVYISSHGRARETGPGGLSYVMTYDFSDKNDVTAFTSGLKMYELAEFARLLKANNYVLILDTCYSAAVTPAQRAKQGGSGLEDPLQGLQGSANRVILSASHADETSVEDKKSRHGLFTRFLLDALADKNADLTTIFKSVEAHVVAESQNQQHPVMFSYGQGGKISLGAPLEAQVAHAPERLAKADEKRSTQNR